MQLDLELQHSGLAHQHKQIPPYLEHQLLKLLVLELRPHLAHQQQQDSEQQQLQLPVLLTHPLLISVLVRVQVGSEQHQLHQLQLLD